MEIGLLVSGNLGLLVFQELMSRFNIQFVLTDRNSNGIIELCDKSNIPFYAGNPRNGKALKKLPYVKCELLVSVNYLFLIEDDIISLPKKIAINFHGSLLPKYRGRTPHVWAIINNEKETGVTAHVIDNNCDTGDIIAQKKISIDAEDTGASILEKYKNIYPGFVMEVLQSIKDNTYSRLKQYNVEATYFGKRTENDGQIDWNWQRERINNWVRAQAKPYPGAFTFNDENKIIIHKIKFSEFGFLYHMSNGLIIGFNNKIPIVKTPNGCIELIDYQSNCTLELNHILK